MKQITRLDVISGKMFSDGKNAIYEIIYYAFLHDEKPLFNSITVGVHEFCTNDFNFKYLGTKDVKLEELKPIPCRAEFERIWAYNI